MKRFTLFFSSLFLFLTLFINSIAQTIPSTTIEAFWNSDGTAENYKNVDRIGAAKWGNGQPLPFASYYSTAFTDNNQLIIGGGDITGGGFATNIVTTYNVESNTYGNIANLPQPLRLSAGIKFGNSYRVFGGFTNGNNDPLDVHYKYDIGTSSWSTSVAIPLGTFYTRALNKNDEGIYLIAGSDASNNLLANVRFFRGSDETWHNATDLPSPSADGAAEFLNERTLIYIGGFRPGFESALQVDTVFIGEIDPNDPLVINWTIGLNFPGGPRARFHAYRWGYNQVIVVGGSNSGAFSSFSDAWVYNHDTETWTSWTQQEDKPTPITAYQGGSFQLADDVWKLVIAGGITTGPALTAVNEIFTDTIPAPANVQTFDDGIPTEYVLFQNYPNPFNPSTTIQFSIPEESFVKLEVFNALGEKVSTLVSETLSGGRYEYEWSAANLPGGIYYYRLIANGFEATKKLVLLK